MSKVENVELIRSVLARQILGSIDSARSKEYWLNLLKNVPHDDIAEALSTELTHFNYAST